MTDQHRFTKGVPADPQADATDATEGCAACGKPASPRVCTVITQEPCKLCDACWMRSIDTNRAAIEARRSQPQSAPKAEPVGCEHGLGFACGCKPMPPVQKRDPYAEHRERLKMKCHVVSESDQSLEQRIACRVDHDDVVTGRRGRLVAALALDLACPVGPRYPTEGRSERALPVTNGRKP